MIAIDLGVARVEQALRLVRALGSHRYVAGRLHLVHVFALAAASDDPAEGDPLAEARAWARSTMATAGLDLASRDERLWRASSDAEVAALLDAFWTPGARASASRAALARLLREHELETGDHAPFDESVEETVHPLLIDAGWELLQLAELDPERHKGAIGAFGEPLAFESALFEEETAIPSVPALVELPAFGALELLRGADDDGALVRPFVIWTQGNETYFDYLLRGVARAAKLDA